MANLTRPKHQVFKKVHGTWKELGNERENTAINYIKKKSEYAINNLEEKSVIELEELLWRQQKIINGSRHIIIKLPDKGQKLKLRLEEIKSALKIKQNDASNFNGTKTDMESFEWSRNGKDANNSCPKSSKDQALISDEEDESNPLELLATHSVDVPRRRTFSKTNKNSEDLASEIEEELKQLSIQDEKFKSSNNNLPFSDSIIKNIEEKEKAFQMKKKKVFKTNWTLNHVEKSATISIPLKESLLLMEKANKTQLGCWHQQAQNSLLGGMPMRIGLPESDFTQYRDVNRDSHVLDEESDEEQYEPLAYINGQEGEL